MRIYGGLYKHENMQGGRPPPLFLDQTEARRAEKILLLFILQQVLVCC